MKQKALKVADINILGVTYDTADEIEHLLKPLGISWKRRNYIFVDKEA